MAAIGNIEPFDEANGSWDVYSERLTAYLSANSIGENKQVNAFLAIVGGKTYGLLRSLLSPVKPSTKTLPELVDVLTAHFSPKPVVISQRHRFRNRIQGPHETISDYLATLRELTEHCDFKQGLNDQLRDQFVCGLASNSIQKRLLSEEGLDLDKAVKIAVSMETAARDMQELNVKTTAQVHRMSRKGGTRGKEDKRKQFPKCKSCGKTNHDSRDCWMKSVECYKCGKVGHTQYICKSKQKPPREGYLGNKKKGQVHHMDEAKRQSEETVEDECELPLFFIKDESEVIDSIWVYPVVEGAELKMELDTGSAYSIISLEEYKKRFAKIPMNTTEVILKTYTQEPVRPEGTLNVAVQYNGVHYNLKLFVLKGSGPALFGRSWLHKIQLDWPAIRQIRKVPKEAKEKLQDILQDHAEVFKNELGTLKNVKARIEAEEDTTPKYVKARPVPYSLRQKVDDEIDRLVKENILEPIDCSEWATPIVPVVKKNGSVRLCGDFKVTLNPVLKRVEYPLPRIEDLLANLSGGQEFTKLDLSNAYQQMLVDDESRRLLVLNTQKGLFRFNRLPFGVASAPAIFQRTMEQVLQGIPGVLCYMDDLLVTGKTAEEHLRNLKNVLRRLQEWGIRVSREKCFFFQESIVYLGHKIDKDGLHTTDDKVNAVLNAPAPENVSQLRSFLGLLNYYNRFLPNLSMVIRPLNRLLEKGTEWEWSESADTAFKKAKTLLLSADVLVHYNPDLPVTLACDASPYGVGAVLSHITNHGEKPIAFISRTLTKTEQNYAQIDKESLAKVFGVRKFSQYLIGKKFTLITDHQPLVKILGPKTAIPPLAAARFQRWAMMLSAYDYNIVYRNSKNNANADGLSRLPIPEQVPRNVMDAAAVFNMSQLESLPVKSAQVASETKKDNDLSLAMDYTLTGWTKPEVQSLQPFYIRRNELTVQGGCLMWGMRVIIPANLRPVVLNELHIGHPGIVKMKALARSYVWWPNLNEQIEQTVKSCAECMKCQNQPSPAPLHPWRYPDGPWHRIHVDFAGPFMGKMFFVVVDAYSKWPEVVVMNSTTSEKTIDVLRSVFSRHGLPQQLVSDNGPQFVSSEFQQFMARNGVQHITSSPYHPETNGLAERFVQTLKQSLRESVSNSNAPLQQQLSVFLMRYRNTPHSTTKEAPAVLLIGRRLRSRLDLLKPNIAMTVAEAQEKQIQERGAGKVRTDTFEPNQPVLARNYREGAKWVPGTVVDKSGPVSYKVQVNPGSVWRRHTDQLLPCSNPVMAGDVSASSINLEQTAELPECANPVITSETDTDSDKQIPAQERRYPVRERRPPNRLDL